jgi:hypothetical protein
MGENMSAVVKFSPDPYRLRRVETVTPPADLAMERRCDTAMQFLQTFSPPPWILCSPKGEIAAQCRRCEDPDEAKNFIFGRMRYGGDVGLLMPVAPHFFAGEAIMQEELSVSRYICIEVRGHAADIESEIRRCRLTPHFELKRMTQKGTGKIYGWRLNDFVDWEIAWECAEQIAQSKFTYARPSNIMFLPGASRGVHFINIWDNACTLGDIDKMLAPPPVQTQDYYSGTPTPGLWGGDFQQQPPIYQEPERPYENIRGPDRQPSSQPVQDQNLTMPADLLDEHAEGHGT